MKSLFKTEKKLTSRFFKAVYSLGGAEQKISAHCQDIGSGRSREGAIIKTFYLIVAQ
jgi:hypothetical protein